MGSPSALNFSSLTTNQHQSGPSQQPSNTSFMAKKDVGNEKPGGGGGARVSSEDEEGDGKLSVEQTKQMTAKAKAFVQALVNLKQTARGLETVVAQTQPVVCCFFFLSFFLSFFVSHCSFFLFLFFFFLPCPSISILTD
jgi:hypothetical protein